MKTVQICSVLTNKTSKPSNYGLTNMGLSNTVAFICKCSRNTDAKLFTALTPEASYTCLSRGNKRPSRRH